ncbi:MAG: exodeoxyribonuclease VII small subunit [Gemmatimonadetes bacterium]|nr:exodeoxyribonuclease VII small subunit [Gemmatimonadota bacterium]
MADAPNRDVEAGAARDDGSLEDRIARLEEIVQALEADRLELDEALALFEEAVGHIRHAERTLAEAELRVEELKGEGPAGVLRPFEGEGE